MRITVKIPGLNAAASAVLVHFISVFAVAFLTQVVAGWTGTLNVPTLLSLVTSAAAAGVIAVIHVIIGLIPTAPVSPNSTKPALTSPVGIPIKVQSAVYQLLTSAAVVFFSMLGAELVGGATHITSLPDAVALLIAAISAAVTAAVQYFVSLVPAPKT
jgi:hypothetical protein